MHVDDSNTGVHTHVFARDRPHDLVTVMTAPPPVGEMRPVVGGMPAVGGMLGPYRLCAEIGSGGMADVYLARCDGRIGLHHFVALKCIRLANRSDPAYVDMLHDETRIVSLISHPHVCAVVDSGLSEGVHYLAMEYLSGNTLDCMRPLLAGAVGELPGDLNEVRRAALIARLVADASEGLHAAHELSDADGTTLGVVHRDVSPQNLFVTFEGCIKVLDFGLVAATNQRHTSGLDVVKGKLSYIQPEVLQGLRPDRRADVWGLGVVLWELLAGCRLFDRESDAATLQAVSVDVIPPPSSARTGVPTIYDPIVAKALARDPALRYPTARALGRALVRAAAEQGQGIGLADLADLMADLFPGARESRWSILAGALPVAERSRPGERTTRRTGVGASAHEGTVDVLASRKSRWPLGVAAGVAAGTALGITLGVVVALAIAGPTRREEDTRAPTTVTAPAAPAEPDRSPPVPPRRP